MNTEELKAREQNVRLEGRTNRNIEGRETTHFMVLLLLSMYDMR